MQPPEFLNKVYENRLPELDDKFLLQKEEVPSIIEIDVTHPKNSEERYLFSKLNYVPLENVCQIMQISKENLVEKEAYFRGEIKKIEEGDNGKTYGQAVSEYFNWTGNVFTRKEIKDQLRIFLLSEYFLKKTIGDPIFTQDKNFFDILIFYAGICKDEKLIYDYLSENNFFTSFPKFYTKYAMNFERKHRFLDAHECFAIGYINAGVNINGINKEYDEFFNRMVFRIERESTSSAKFNAKLLNDKIHNSIFLLKNKTQNIPLSEVKKLSLPEKCQKLLELTIDFEITKEGKLIISNLNQIVEQPVVLFDKHKIKHIINPPCLLEVGKQLCFIYELIVDFLRESDEEFKHNQEQMTKEIKEIKNKLPFSFLSEYRGKIIQEIDNNNDNNNINLIGDDINMTSNSDTNDSEINNSIINSVEKTFNAINNNNNNATNNINNNTIVNHSSQLRNSSNNSNPAPLQNSPAKINDLNNTRQLSTIKEASEPSTVKIVPKKFNTKHTFQVISAETLKDAVNQLKMEEVTPLNLERNEGGKTGGSGSLKEIREPELNLIDKNTKKVIPSINYFLLEAKLLEKNYYERYEKRKQELKNNIKTGRISALEELNNILDSSNNSSYNKVKSSLKLKLSGEGKGGNNSNNCSNKVEKSNDGHKTVSFSEKKYVVELSPKIDDITEEEHKKIEEELFKGKKLDNFNGKKVDFVIYSNFKKVDLMKRNSVREKKEENCEGEDRGNAGGLKQDNKQIPENDLLDENGIIDDYLLKKNNENCISVNAENKLLNDIRKEDKEENTIKPKKKKKGMNKLNIELEKFLMNFNKGQNKAEKEKIIGNLGLKDEREPKNKSKDTKKNKSKKTGNKYFDKLNELFG